MKYYLFAYWHDPRWEKFVGATVKIWDLAKNLSKDGNDVTLFVPNYHFPKDVPFKIVEIAFIDLPVVRLLSYNCFLLCKLLLSYSFNKPDVVYSRRMTSLLPMFYAKACRKVFFYEVNDDPYHITYNRGSKIKFHLRAFISQIIDETNLRYCHRAFVISKEIIAKILKENPAIETGKLKILPSGANTDLFKPEDKFECRQTIGLDTSKKYVGFVGTLLKHQGVHVLIDAAVEVIQEESLCAFVIIGEGPMRSEWEELVAQKGIEAHFHFAGQIDYERVPLWINAMDICVAPFIKEAGLRSPVKLFDYMACGKAVIASKIEGTTDFFEKSNTVEFVAPGDAVELGRAIYDLIRDQNKAETMGRIGRKFIEKDYDRKNLAKKIQGEVVKLRS